MPQQQRSYFGPIVQAIKTQLVTYTGIPEHRVLLRARHKQAKTTHPVQGRQYLVIRPYLPRPIGEWTEAAGRVNKGVSRPVEIIARTRLGLDQMDRDDNFLLNEDEGHFLLEELVFDALEMFMPEDADTNIIVARPIRCIPSPEPTDKDEPVDPQWGSSSLFFDVWYQLDLDQSRQ
jgi:hypothetical protein